MAKLTRRGFIRQTSVGVATLGVLAAAPLAADSEIPQAAATDLTELSAAALSNSAPLVAHVSNLATGEISLLVGTQEIIFRDPQIVMRLLQQVVH